MPIRVERILFKIGEGGIAITLPKAWINYYHLKPGDRVEIIAEKDLIIQIKEPDTKDAATKIDSGS
jgi:bifunctional DNA-binding transcriptional regulator/antitoxin component of YhaV-PrlF toxin-antitoxin module